MKRPASLTVAVVLQWISAIAGLWVGGIFLLASLAMFDPEARIQIADALKEAGVSGIEPSMVVIAFVLLAVLIIVISIVRLIIAVALGRGRNWSRVVITVFSALTLAGAIGQVFGGEWITGAVSIVIELAILWLMWNAASSAYIKAKTAEHAAAKA